MANLAWAEGGPADPARPHLRLGALGGPALWILFFLILLAPIAFFLVVAVAPAAADQGTSWFTLAPFITALSGPTLRGLLDSLVLSASTAILSLGVGLLLAWLVQRTNLRGRGLWTLLVWVVLLTPSFWSRSAGSGYSSPRGCSQTWDGQCRG